LPVHRRSALRHETPPRRSAAAARGRRRASSRPHRGLPVLLGLALLGVGALAGPRVVGDGWNPDPGRGASERITLAGKPADSPELGLVYGDLEPAKKDTLCAGSYELVTPETCTHGPDSAPAGLKVDRDVSPVTPPAVQTRTPARETGPTPSDAEIVRDEGGVSLAPGQPALIPDAAPGEAAFVMGSHDVACEGDGRTGKRVQVLYLHEFGSPSRYAEYLGSIRSWSAGVDSIIDASAAETAGSRHVRFVTTPQCRVDVAEVQVPEDALASFRNSINALRRLGYNRTDRKYLIFADTNVYCGIGTFIADRRPGQGNRNNGGPSYGRIDSGCWSAGVATHELAHNLGAGLEDSPNASGLGHCTDDYDLLCGKDAAKATVRVVCPSKSHELRLDCNHDDYFSTDPKDGSYLAENWNIAQNEFLLRGDGGDDLPDVAPTRPATSPASSPAADPAEPSSTAIPTGTATGTASPSTRAEVTQTGPTDDQGGSAAPPAGPAASEPAPPPADEVPDPVQAVLEVRDATSTSVRLTWSAAATKATYEVAVDGVTIATTPATRARLIGLRPDTRYKVTISDAARGYTARGTAQTAPAARPARSSWFVLTNSLTGDAADLYAARSATGTPIVLNGAEGGTQQQWKLVPAGDDTFWLQSRASGKCVLPLDGNPVAGAPLVQADCTSAGAQRWAVRNTDHGFSLGTTVGGLVVGVGAQRFGANRLLVLQTPDLARHQSWTALPG
jgi:hypothetical protein